MKHTKGGIENGLHYCRDKTLLEDDTRICSLISTLETPLGYF